MKSLFYAFLLLFSFSFIMSCSDSDVETTTGPSGVSKKLDTLESPGRVWVDTAALYLNLDTTEYFFIDTIVYEAAVLDDDGNVDSIFEASVIISSKDTLVTYNEPAGMIRVNWSKVEGADYYYILVTDTGIGSVSYYWEVPLDTSLKSFILDGETIYYREIPDLKPEYSYDIYVFGYNSVDKERGARTKSDRSIHLKGAPSPISISVSVTGNTARVEWSEVEDARRYNVIYTDILTDSSFTKTTLGAELSTLIDVKENGAYKVRVVPEGFVVIDSVLDSMLTLDSAKIELGPSFSKIDTIYPYDPSMLKNSTTFLLPYVIFSTFENLSESNNMQAVKGGYYLKGDIWSAEGQKSLKEVIVNSFQLGVNEITNKEYVEFLNYMQGNDVSLLDELKKVLTFSKSIWDTTISATVKLDSTNSIGDTIILKVPVEIDTIFNAVYLDTITAGNSLFPGSNVVFSVEDQGEIYYDTVIQDTFVYSVIVSDTFTLIDTIIFTGILDTLHHDSIVFDSVFSMYATFSDTIHNTTWKYSDISIAGKPYSLIEANTLIKIDKESLIAVVDPALYNNPVKGVTWEGAAEYCNWLSDINGYSHVFIKSGSSFTIDTTANGFRLPTEAEYEYCQSAAFLGVRQKYSWGSFWPSSSTSLDSLTSVNNLKGYFGLKGMDGNLIEWCMDNVEYNSANYLSDSLNINPINMNGSDHILKGGAFSDEDKVTTFMSSYNLKEKPSSLGSVGFRVAR